MEGFQKGDRVEWTYKDEGDRFEPSSWFSGHIRSCEEDPADGSMRYIVKLDKGGTRKKRGHVGLRPERTDRCTEPPGAGDLVQVYFKRRCEWVSAKVTHGMVTDDGKVRVRWDNAPPGCFDEDWVNWKRCRIAERPVRKETPERRYDVDYDSYE